MRFLKITAPAVLAVFALAFAYCESNPYREGERLYKFHCSNCHLDDGKGLGALIPPIAGASEFLDANRERLPCILKYGLKDTIEVKGVRYAEAMPGVPTLSAIQITNILNFIHHTWGDGLPPYRLDEVEHLLSECPK